LKKKGSVLERVRGLLCDQCGPLGLGELNRQFVLGDDDGSLTLSGDEFRKVFGKLGLYLNNREIEEVFWEFDRDGNGGVDYEEFMDGVRGGSMSRARRKLVKQAWQHATGGGGGSATVDVNDLMHAFDCLWFPSVTVGGVDAEDVTAAVSKRFCGDGGNQREVGFQQFFQFHWDVSATLEGDRVFESAVRNMWNLRS